MTLIIRNNSYLEWNKWLELSISGVRIGVPGRKMGLPLKVKEQKVKPIQVSEYSIEIFK